MNGFLARRFAARAGCARLSLSAFLVALSVLTTMPVAWADGFSFGPQLATRRESHSATLLPSGKVLVVGGYNTGGNLASTELYDPDTATWGQGASLATSRDQHTATLLPSGEVLVVGGRASDGHSALSSAELYDPASDTWRSAAAMSDPRYGHTATLLSSGKVLVAAGMNGSGPLASAEIYDPFSDTWSPAAALSVTRMNAAATQLASGKVLVSGGFSGSYLASVEIYDEASNTWTPAASLSSTRAFHTSTLLPSGDVLVVGGYGDSTYLMNAELYHADTDVWTPAGTLANPRFFHTATLLASGKVLAAGGNESSGPRREELYGASSNSWVSAGVLNTARDSHTATLLPSGKVLITGGFGNGVLASTELYDPATTTNTTVVSATPTTTVVGQSYDVSFTVTSTSGTPTGSVTVSDDAGASCGPVILTNGAGSCSLVSTSAGQRIVTASYVPDDAVFAASSGNTGHGVDKADTTLQIQSDDPDPSLPGQPVTVTVAFAVVAPGSGTPSQPIVVGADGDYCEIPPGSNSCVVTFHQRGVRSFNAVFSGDDNFNDSFASTAHVVNTSPVAVNDDSSAYEDTPLNVSAQDGVLANDSDPDGEPIVVISTGPFTAGGIGGQGVMNSDGSFTYAPPANANGTATFEYTMTDGTATATATLEIDVAPVNDPPHFVMGADQNWPPGASGPKVVPAFAEVTDYGPPNESGQHVQAWIVGRISDPVGVIDGKVTIALDGTLSYTLSGRAGIATFGVQLQDDGGTANGGNDTSSAQTLTITVATGADLSIAIDDGTAFAVGGDPLLYMITVRNLGPDNASGAHVRDLLPSNLVDATWTCVPSAGALCAASGNGDIDDQVDLPSGATLIYELTATVLASPETAVDNVVSVTAPTGVTDVNPANNTATDIDATGIFADGFDRIDADAEETAKGSRTR